jgi:hypothetical protein
MRLRTGQSGLASKPLAGSIKTVTVANAGVGAEGGGSVEVDLSSGTASSRFGLRAASPRVLDSVRFAASTSTGAVCSASTCGRAWLRLSRKTFVVTAKTAMNSNTTAHFELPPLGVERFGSDSV